MANDGSDDGNEEQQNLDIAKRWCAQKGPQWRLIDQAGRGGTAPVFGLTSPEGVFALKVYDEQFSSGAKGTLEEIRVHQQIALGRHGCPYLVEVYDGGRFESRLILLMNRAPGQELEKVLASVPRDEIRGIADKVAQACQFLRLRGLCHRDIKSANIFVTEDFKQVTLLDLSVMRDLTDPVGIGTDHGNQLPVVATARYSPPEYLFRLEDPSPEYWHGLDVYQLGGLLHDLIMRKPMFDEEYQAGKENRYRFAWAVATRTPLISAEDVDQDLVSLARRSIDKNWARRRLIQLDDFRVKKAGEQKLTLAIFGLGPTATVHESGQREPAPLRSLAKAVEAAISDRLRYMGVTPIHDARGEDSWRSANLDFQWDVQHGDSELEVGRVHLRVYLSQTANLGQPMIRCVSALSATVDGADREAKLELPDVEDDVNASATLSDNIMGSLSVLSATAVSAKAIGG
jgi:hypothetical protein